MLMNSMNNGNIQKAGSFPLLGIPNCKIRKIIAVFAYIKYDSANYLSCLLLEFVYFIVDIGPLHL